MAVPSRRGPAARHGAATWRRGGAAGAGKSPERGRRPDRRAPRAFRAWRHGRPFPALLPVSIQTAPIIFSTASTMRIEWPRRYRESGFENAPLHCAKPVLRPGRPLPRARDAPAFPRRGVRLPPAGLPRARGHTGPARPPPPAGTGGAAPAAARNPYLPIKHIRSEGLTARKAAPALPAPGARRQGAGRRRAGPGPDPIRRPKTGATRPKKSRHHPNG